MELKDLQPIKIGEMVRVGDKEDGGYVIPAHFKNSRLNLISIGLGDNWSFETQGKGIFFDKFISVDHTVSLLSILGRLFKRIVSKKIKLSTLFYFLKLIINYLRTFRVGRNTHIRKKLVSENNKRNRNEITLDECFIEINTKKVALKIDIEGAERLVLEKMPDKILERLKCIAGEFHCYNESFDDFQNNFVSRCYKFGFQSFVLYQGDGRLRTIHLWKD